MTLLDKYVITCIHNYPTLYHDKSYTESKMKVLDKFLNTIGNGVRDNEELEEEIDIVNDDLTMDDIENYITDKKIFNGYTKVRKLTDDYDIPDLDSSIDTSVLEKDKGEYPSVVYWSESKHFPMTPYPNFQKEYSTIYQCSDYLKLDISFIEGAIEYYEYIEEWFEKFELKYHYAFPKKTEKETNKSITEMESLLDKYNSNDEITEVYGVEYNGDVYEFQSKRWQKEKNRILEFIHETISMLMQEKIKKI